MNFFNPKLKEMFEENPNQSVVGFAWAIGWRLQLAIFVIYIIVIIALAIITAISGFIAG